VTTTMDRTGIESTTTAGTETLLALLHDALSACEEQDLGLLDAKTPAGSALVSLSALARGAAGALGTAPGRYLTEGPGVVVVRDLVTATRLLARAASRTNVTSDLTSEPDVGNLVATAKARYAELLDALTPAA
jgi:hypothetical protein